MVVDAECGMPLDLGKWEALWEDGADDHGKRSPLCFKRKKPQTMHSLMRFPCLFVFFCLFSALNPDPRNPPLLDPKDQALLLDPGSSAPDYGRLHGHGHHGPGTPPMSANVSWLRKTEYISRDSTSPSTRPAAADMFVLTIVDFSLPYTFLQNKLPERCSGHIARGAARLHREFFCCREHLRAARFTAASDQTAPARRFNVRGTPRRRRMGERIRPVPVQRTTRRAWARGAFCGHPNVK